MLKCKQDERVGLSHLQSQRVRSEMYSHEFALPAFRSLFSITILIIIWPPHYLCPLAGSVEAFLFLTPLSTAALGTCNEYSSFQRRYLTVGV